MRILTVGGGSGGHVTPVVAVIHEIKKSYPNAEIRFWCDYKFYVQASEILANFDKMIPVQKIVAGKLRRYHHLSFARQLFWPSLMYANFKDSFLVVAGFFQSIFKLIAWRPDVVFAKGGYVCLPVGIATKLLGIPLVIHDSDAHPGLTNRILSRWADKIATGAPLKYYSYPKNKTEYVGIPVAEYFKKFSKNEMQNAKKEWGIDEKLPLVVITGGGLGASRMNNATVLALPDLLRFCSVVLISGVSQYDELRAIVPKNSNHFQLHSFISKNMASLFGASDVVVTRAGATTIVELASLEKPTILVPNAKLSGGHQLKNASVYLDSGAVKVIDEDTLVKNPHVLVETLASLLSDTESMRTMSKNFASFSKPNSARDVADMVISLIK